MSECAGEQALCLIFRSMPLWHPGSEEMPPYFNKVRVTGENWKEKAT